MNSDWILDSGASHHITSDLSNLSLHSPYEGGEDIVIGDGNKLHISHIGTLCFAGYDMLRFTDVLLVPSMAKNLLSVSRLCRDNVVHVVFFASEFQVKDRRTGVLLLRGPRINGLYIWPARARSQHLPSALLPVKQSLPIWHARLGHPSSKILQAVVSNHNLAVCRSFDFSCNSCRCIKSLKLPFSESTLHSAAPLELLFSDVWTSPVLSVDGYKYYVIFVDHYTKYVWLYPLKLKYDVFATFVAFKALVEKFFKRKITVLYSDNDGEYIALRPFLTSHGVTHLTTPPHTPENNGMSVETGLALLHQASMPFSYWTYAMFAATYLINRLPKVEKSMQSAYQKLMHQPPNIIKLRVFGCECYPWLRPYSSHKLTTRSTPYVFVGYSLTQTAYICLDLSTDKIYTSHHVEFVEDSFPFATSPYHPSPPTPPINLDPLPLPPPV